MGPGAQPLEFNDFSGGITENFMQGDPRRYQTADNYLITVDKKLVVREGDIPYDSPGSQINYMLPVLSRVNGLYTVINETILLAQSGRKMHYIDPVNGWTAITGPGGNQAIQGGDAYNQTSLAEFQHQTYLASDGGSIGNSQGVQPSKIFRDTNNAWTALTVGLPRSYSTPNYTVSSLLTSCIVVANALRTSMINHMSDANNDGNTALNVNWTVNFKNLHHAADHYSLSYFATQTFGTNTTLDPVPSPLPTPAPAASDQASLFTLVTALIAAFNYHTGDPLGNNNTSNLIKYHFDIKTDVAGTVARAIKGPNAALVNNGTPTTVATAAAILDDLNQKWNWHRKSVWTHSPSNDPAQFDKYDPNLTKILPAYTANGGPTVTADYTDLFNYVNNLKTAYNTHVYSFGAIAGGGLGGVHTQADYEFIKFVNGVTPSSSSNMTKILLPDCTDLDSMYLLIYWMRVLYGTMHVQDAGVSTYQICRYTSSAGSNVLTAVTNNTVPNTIIIPVGSWIYSPGTDGSVFLPVNTGSSGLQTAGDVARVISSSLGTCTIDRIAIITVINGLGQYSNSWYHMANQNTVNFNADAFANGDLINTPTTLPTVVEGQASYLATPATTLGTDPKSWLTLANEFFNCFAAHTNTGTGNILNYRHANIRLFSTYINAPTTNPFFIPSVGQVSYALFFSHSYTVEPNGIQYLVQGNPIIVPSQQLAISYPVSYSISSQNISYYPNVLTQVTRANVLSNLPVLTNDTNTNYDLANVKLNIYKTTDGGTTYYLLAQVNNGTTSYSDTTNDQIAVAGALPLSTQQPIYTTGGVVGSDQPPVAKYVHNLNGTFFYGGITDTGQYFPNRIRQAIPFSPDSAPATFVDDMDDEITGITSTRNNFLIFCKNSLYRENGGFNSLGQGALTHERISDVIGCLNAKSIVKTEIGVFFAGSDGFYYTDGYQLIKISLDLDKTYAYFTQSQNQKQRIWGCYDKATRRVWWSVQYEPTDTDNSATYVFYLDYGVKPSGTFTRAVNGVYWRPSSMVFQNGMRIRGDERGYILRADPYAMTDAKIDVTLSPPNWGKIYLPYNFTSTAVDMGTTFKRKYLTKIHSTGKNTGNASIQINAIRDMNQDGDGIKPLTAINYLGNCRWGNPTFTWGDSTFIWRYDGKMDLWRRFPATSLRADFLQIQYVPARIAVYASSAEFPVGANVTVDATLKTATILTPSGYSAIIWPIDVVDYYIAFQTDNYVQEFLITALDVTNKIVTFSDASNLSVAGTVAWVIRGIKKQQRHTITSFVIHYAYLGDKTQAYPGKYTTSGTGNAGENPS